MREKRLVLGIVSFLPFLTQKDKVSLKNFTKALQVLIMGQVRD